MEKELRDIAAIVVKRSKRFPQSKAVASRVLKGKPVQMESILSSLDKVDCLPADYQPRVQLGVISWLMAVLFDRVGEDQLAQAYAWISVLFFSAHNTTLGLSP